MKKALNKAIHKPVFDSISGVKLIININGMMMFI